MEHPIKVDDLGVPPQFWGDISMFFPKFHEHVRCFDATLQVPEQPGGFLHGLGRMRFSSASPDPGFGVAGLCQDATERCWAKRAKPSWFPQVSHDMVW